MNTNTARICGAYLSKQDWRVKYTTILKFGYQGKNLETKTYQQLLATTEKYASEPYLHQSIHRYTTQINEVFNYSQVCLTPKAKKSHESESFFHRDAICIGVHNQIMRRFWTSTFDCVGVLYTMLFTSYLEMVDKKRKR